jgi:hypothetical protein
LRPRFPLRYSAHIHSASLLHRIGATELAPKPYTPTDEQRRTVRAMAGFGVPQDDIALVVRCTSRTLRKWYR